MKQRLFQDQISEAVETVVQSSVFGCFANSGCRQPSCAVQFCDWFLAVWLSLTLILQSFYCDLHNILLIKFILYWKPQSISVAKDQEPKLTVWCSEVWCYRTDSGMYNKADERGRMGDTEDTTHKGKGWPWDRTSSLHHQEMYLKLRRLGKRFLPSAHTRCGCGGEETQEPQLIWKRGLHHLKRSPSWNWVK